jgi:hypothetical protein
MARYRGGELDGEFTCYTEDGRRLEVSGGFDLHGEDELDTYEDLLRKLKNFDEEER